MFAPANLPQFVLDLPGLEHDFQVLAFHGREALSEPFRFELELISENPAVALEDFLQQPAYLQLGAEHGIHGLVESLAQGDAGQRMTRYHLVLKPQLAWLELRRNSRIFQHLTVPQIIGRVLDEHGILAGAGHRFELGSEYPERIYCTQYAESDLHFVQRLCEEEGIHYHFQHSPDGHQLVFGDDQTLFPTLAETRYHPGTGMVADEPVIKRFNLRAAVRTAAVGRRDYDFEKPRLRLEANVSDDEQGLEDYGFPGRFTERERGRHLARRRLESHRHDHLQAEGRSDQPILCSGHLLPLAEHPREEWNDLWLLAEVRHEGKQPQVLEESVTSTVGNALKTVGASLGLSPSPLAREGRGEGADDFTQGYRNHFTALPWDVPYRPEPSHPKPRLFGAQSAVVTGPEGEEIHCDQYGRIKVQFHWDREGQADDKTSCWMRVSSSWAGDRYGGIAIPRIGMEVLVSFLEGDPDQPLVTGCLYHAENQVPYDLPANRTRSVFKTLSSPGGGGYNELRIEDRKGAEQIYVHAQRDWDENIEHDQKIRIGNERHDTVEANSYTELKAEEHRTTHADRKVELRGDDHLTVANNQHVKLGTGQFVEAGNEIHYHAGRKVVIDAGMELTAKGGGSFLKLDPGGITLSGANIKMNSGGGPGKGSGAKPLLPGPLAQADADKAGNLLVRAEPEQRLAPPRGICIECLLKAMREGAATLAGASA